MRITPSSWLLGLGLLSLSAVPAAATPSFALEISFGGVDELAVGETLQCYAYRPTVHRRADVEPLPLSIPLKWWVVPKDAATIDARGRLTARKAGQITVHVNDARRIPKGDLPAGVPGQRKLVLSNAKDMDGKRLPRVTGLAALHHFKIAWSRDYDNEKRRYTGEPFLSVGVSTKRWNLSVGTASPGPGPLPWTLERVKLRSYFHDDGYVDLIDPSMVERWRANLTDATLTIRSYAKGVARGTLSFKTRRGVNEDLRFVARIPDPKGVLAKAAAAAKPK
ncbi:MAG: hypothetical protein QNJ98_09605 [Planctomycetota bacterium]|nr:hypothetical protein [Planctomycetota bacterium]